MVVQKKTPHVESSFAKGLSVLDLFEEGSMSVHIDNVVQLLKTSRATAYRYLATLCDAGLLASATGGVYVLGPRIIELERLVRISDPLLLAGSKVMHEVSNQCKLNMLLASYYRDRIMCVDIAWPDARISPRFERGKPMSMFRGAMAKIILAHLSHYQLRNIALNHAEEIRDAGLGKNWAEFRTQMAEMARNGYAITRAEMMLGSGGISAPILDAERRVLGSLTFAIPDSDWDRIDFELLRKQLHEACSRISASIANHAGAKEFELITGVNQ